MNGTRSANVAAEILLNTSSANVAGTSPLIASAISRIVRLVGLFEVILKFVKMLADSQQRLSNLC